MHWAGFRAPRLPYAGFIQLLCLDSNFNIQSLLALSRACLLSDYPVRRAPFMPAFDYPICTSRYSGSDVELGITRSSQ